MPDTKYSCRQVPIWSRHILPDISGSWHTQYSCCAGYIRQLAVKGLIDWLTDNLFILNTISQDLQDLCYKEHMWEADAVLTSLMRFFSEK